MLKGWNEVDLDHQSQTKIWLVEILMSTDQMPTYRSDAHFKIIPALDVKILYHKYSRKHKTLKQC